MGCPRLAGHQSKGAGKDDASRENINWHSEHPAEASGTRTVGSAPLRRLVSRHISVTHQRCAASLVSTRHAAHACQPRHCPSAAVNAYTSTGLSPAGSPTCMCCVLGRPLHRSTPWPACCRRRSGATLNLLPGPQSVSRDARPARSCSQRPPLILDLLASLFRVSQLAFPPLCGPATPSALSPAPRRCRRRTSGSRQTGA